MYYVYLMASRRDGVIYTGVTNDLERRVSEHKLKQHPKSFTRRYNIFRLVYYETYGQINEAIAREKRIKKWKRQWKIVLIEKENPEWRDLSQSWY